MNGVCSDGYIKTKTDYVNKISSMTDIITQQKWKQFIAIYGHYFVRNINVTINVNNNIDTDIVNSIANHINNSINPKSTIIKSTSNNHNNIEQSSVFQKISKNMSSQHSETTQLMFETNSDLWQQYHNARDHNLKDHGDQCDIPVNRIYQ